MEKDYSLQCIDYAVAMTKEKSRQDINLQKLDSAEHLTTAITEYMFNNNAMGFSSFGEGRKYIQELSKEDIEEQLLKHVVKSEIAKRRNGLLQQMGTNKNFGEDLSQTEVQVLMYRALNQMDMSGIKYLLDKYPVLYTSLAANFVEDRYFNRVLGEERLDAEIPDSEVKFYYDKIDSYYNELRQNMEISIQK